MKMKIKLLAVSVFALTVLSISLYPLDGEWNVNAKNVIKGINQNTVHAQQQNKIEVVFVLDTTGSMSGLIQAAKEKIWSIATSMASAESSPEIKVGLVAYRDRGDAYVTKTVGLSHDLDSVYSKLMDFKANGGGDGPESVNKALFDAVNNISWSQGKGVYKVVFLVGDAPPHMDYKGEAQYPEIVQMAHDKGIVINAIQSGNNQSTRKQWMHMASLGQGEYFQVGQSGNAVAVHTPYDKKMAVLSKKLDDTRIYYGTKQEREKQSAKVKATDKMHAKSSLATRARRAEFNMQKSGKLNRLGKNELVDDVASGRISLDSLDEDKLPASIQALPKPQQLKLIKEKAKLRSGLLKEIKDLSGKRKQYINAEVKKTGAAEASLDEKIYKTVRQQAAKKGLEYKEDSAAY